MATWVYLAGAALATQPATFNVAFSVHVIYRPIRNSRGNRIANVQHLRPGDCLLLAYRQPPGQPIVMACASIAPVNNPVQGTDVIEEVPLTDELVDAGYVAVRPGVVEVIRLEDMYDCQFALVGRYAGQGAIHRLSEDDAGFRQLCPGCGVEDDFDPTEVASNGPAKLALSESAETAIDNTVSVSIFSPVASVKRAFDCYVMVDWSSKNRPSTGKDSIWLAWGEWCDGSLTINATNAPTRAKAMDILYSLLRKFDLQRVLIGLDFAFGYPRGFGTALHLEPPLWRTLLSHFQTNVNDDDRNRHNRDDFAAQCNRSISEGPGPFWACHNGAARENLLTTQRVGVFEFPHRGLEQWRLTELAVQRRGKRPQSVWQLNQGVSVGGQTILGIRYLASLLGEPEFADKLSVWPFQTGWTLPEKNSYVVAEIFPSLLEIDEGLLQLTKDKAQVITCVQHAAASDAVGQLVNFFARPRNLTDEHSRIICEEEGWILFA